MAVEMNRKLATTRVTAPTISVIDKRTTQWSGSIPKR
jgi:hypothetical protein